MRSGVTLDMLTPTQRKVLVEAGKGRTSEQIGEKLGMAKATVDWHVSCIHEALGTCNKVHLSHACFYFGLVVFSGVNVVDAEGSR